jgi:hypothetical protein
MFFVVVASDLPPPQKKKKTANQRQCQFGSPSGKCVKCRGGGDSHLFRQAALPMSVPRNRTIRRIRSQSDPLVATSAEDAVRFELGDVRVRAEVFDAFFFRAFRASAFGG